ncbi:CoA ester lyase [Amorphus sp. 3PC139-8]|uniref:HpcH/HpaI aldolase/citrate lyase family protein n=1 Tax=Amorphus sp. 3PC139-8 TaxID=2735676 RepID=UPI00345D7B6B
MTALPRSYLFVPGDRPERFAKAVASGADRVILDLEDAVLPEAKDSAREAIRTWLADGGHAAIRINGLGTPWHADDLALAASGASEIMLPKAEQGEALSALVGSLPVPLIPLVETGQGILDARWIASLPGVQRLAFGSVDFANDVAVAPDDDWALYFARSAIVTASAAAGIAGPIDGVTLTLTDPKRLSADCGLARRIGMAGKLCIHPTQVTAVNETFRPTPAEIDTARRIVAAANESGGRGGVRVDNKLVDKPIVDRAERLLAGLHEAPSDRR